MEIERACHCTYRIRYHMVFVVKYRKKMLLDKVPLEYFKELLLGIGERYWFKFESVGVEGDHFHIVVGAAPRYSPSSIMQIIKSISAKMIFKRFKEVKKELWGGEFWSDGGYVASVGEGINADIIRDYIQKQGRKGEQLKLYNFV